MANITNQYITLKDGRRLGYAEYGDLQGQPLFYFHGFPASRLEAQIIAAAAERNQWHVIAPDRPGYGLSDFKPKRRIVDWPDDVVELAEALNIDRFSLLGMSGGGPYALVCAWKIPSRLLGVGIMGGLGPVYETWVTRQMKWPARLGFGLAKRAPWLLPLIYGGIMARILRRSPRMMQSLLTISAPAADHSVLERPDIEKIILASMQDALRCGSQGALLEFKLYAHPWGFPLEEISPKIDLWQGEADATVPVSHARYLEQAIPQTEAHYFPNEGHFSLPINCSDRILCALRERRSF